MNSNQEPANGTPFEIFNRALDLTDPAEHKAYLDARCAGNAALRAEVEKLLKHHRADSFLEHTAVNAAVDKEAPTTLDPTREPAPAFAPSRNIKYFGDYELLEEIARGGMGVVYKARQTTLNRLVAVKMILAGQLAGEAEVRRFHTEAEAAANLQHPNIVAIHEVGKHDDRHYFSMDYVEGQNLSALVKEHPITPTKAAELVKTIAEAIQYAHQRGILHRDLKPQNVLMDLQGRPRVTDFGLAKRAGADSSLTQTGAVMGSPSYMPPEQARGSQEEVGPQSDVYSLGAILYHLLTGKAPFVGETPLATLQKVIEEEPALPSGENPAVPADLETICLKCLEKKPERRYGAARSLAEDLERFLNHEPILARPASPWRKISAWAFKHPWVITALLALTGAIAVVALAGFTYGLWQHSQLVAWQASHPGQLSPFRTGSDFINANSPRYIVGKLALFVLFGFYAFFGFTVSKNRPISTAPFSFFALCAAAMFAFAIADVLLTVKFAVWTSPATVRSGGVWNFFGPLFVFGAVDFLLQLFIIRQSRWFGRELVNPARFGPPKLDVSKKRQFLPEIWTRRNDFGRKELLKRYFPGGSIIVGGFMLATAASRDMEWFLTILLCAHTTALALCMLAIGLVPLSLRKRIIENYALFGYGERQNFISIGLFLFLSPMIVVIGSKDFSFMPVVSCLLGGVSLATLVMMLTLRALRAIPPQNLP